MKTVFIYLAILFAFSLTSCDKVDKLLTFNLESKNKIEVPAQISTVVPLGSLVELSQLGVVTSNENVFASYGTSSDLVKDISLDKLTLTLAYPDQDFDFLQDVDIYLSNDANEELLIATYNDIPHGINALELKSTNAKLDKYLLAESYKILTKARMREILTEDVSIDVYTRFKVTADPL